MTLSKRAQEVASKLTDEQPKSGDIKKLAKEIKKDHDLAVELWSTGNYPLRMLATLIFDKKCLSEDDVNKLAADMQAMDDKQSNQLSEWLMANQLMKDKKLTELITTWQHNTSPVLRRLFWYHQARLRWMGKTPPPPNSGELLDALESDMATAEPIVQWTMNFCAAWIGIFEPEYRDRCIKLGEKLGLYKDEKMVKNCTPNYLPAFIEVELAKRG